MICPHCNGEKEFSGIGYADAGCYIIISCALCHGAGEVSFVDAQTYRRHLMEGQRRREERISCDRTLREEARRLRISVTALSQAEQGLRAFPDLEGQP